MRKKSIQNYSIFSSEIKINPQYEQELNAIKDDFLQPEKFINIPMIFGFFEKTLTEELIQETFFAQKLPSQKTLQNFLKT